MSSNAELLTPKALARPPRGILAFVTAEVQFYRRFRDEVLVSSKDRFLGLLSQLL